MVERSQNPAKNRVKPLHWRVQWFWGHDSKWIVRGLKGFINQHELLREVSTMVQWNQLGVDLRTLDYSKFWNQFQLNIANVCHPRRSKDKVGLSSSCNNSTFAKICPTTSGNCLRKMCLPWPRTKISGDFSPGRSRPSRFSAMGLLQGEARTRDCSQPPVCCHVGWITTVRPTRMSQEVRING